MNPRPPFSALSKPALRAFSLLELMFVIAIVSTVAVAVVPSMRGILDGMQVSGAASLVESEMLLARQTAMTRCLPVELRIYKHSGGGDPEPRWRVLGVVIPSASSGRADEWVTSAKVLPGNVYIDDSGDFSTLLANAQPQAAGLSSPWSSRESDSAPGLLRQKNYVAFRFNADGSTNLNGAQPWCLTLRALHVTPAEGGLPASNFVALVLDSLTGRVMAFQP